MKDLQKLVLVIVLCFTVGLTGTAQTAEKEKPTIAVFDFKLGQKATEKITVEGNTHRRNSQIRKSYETSLLSGKLITALTKSGKVSVLERKRLRALMKEVELSRSDLSDPKHSIELGKLLGADYLLFGSVSMLEGSVSHKNLPYETGKQRVMEYSVGADMRIVDAETGKIIAAESMKDKHEEKSVNPDTKYRQIPEKFKQETYQQLAEKMVDAVLNRLFPVRVAAYKNNTVYLNRPGLKKGTKMKVIEQGEKIVDPTSGRALGFTEIPIAIIKITEGLPTFSKATIVEWKTDKQQIPNGALCRPLD